jgi:hypothetical protein
MSSGEVTEALTSWLETAHQNKVIESNSVPAPALPARRKVHWQQSPPGLASDELSIRLCAADPVSTGIDSTSTQHQHQNQLT